jgi:hypothetical protein
MKPIYERPPPKPYVAPEPCKFIARDGDCSKCPHVRKASAKRDAYTPICYQEEEL